MKSTLETSLANFPNFSNFSTFTQNRNVNFNLRLTYRVVENHLVSLSRSAAPPVRDLPERLKHNCLKPTPTHIKTPIYTFIWHQNWQKLLIPIKNAPHP
jgi:hypothetical protein